jgi:prepilin-type N-terminal cleavage/methylation domain-containing protein
MRLGIKFDRRLSIRGFSILELLIVIGVILVVAALAIPSLLHSKMAANEASAVSSLRTIATVEIPYQTTYSIGYAPTLISLGLPPLSTPVSASHAGYIDGVLASGIRGGYAFTYYAVDNDGDGKMDLYTVNANPVSVGQTGERYFFVDQTNVIREALDNPAGPTSRPIPQ